MIKIGKEVLAIAAFLMLAFVVLFRPTITGFVTGTSDIYTGNISKSVSQSFSWSPENAGKLTSLSIDGNGYGEIYLHDDNRKFLVYENKEINEFDISADSDELYAELGSQNSTLEINKTNTSVTLEDFGFWVPDEESTLYVYSNNTLIYEKTIYPASFVDACEETCLFSASGTNFTFFVNGTFFIESIKYTIEEENLAPLFDYSGNLSIYKNTTLDLNYLFNDPENDTLSYIVTSDLDAFVESGIVHIICNKSGESSVKIYASDGENTVVESIDVFCEEVQEPVVSEPLILNQTPEDEAEQSDNTSEEVSENITDEPIAENLSQDQISENITEELENISVNKNITGKQVESLSSERVVVGQPVKWTKRVVVQNTEEDEEVEVRVQVPGYAQNISIIDAESKNAVDTEKVVLKQTGKTISKNLITGHVTGNQETGFFKRFLQWLGGGITGHVVKQPIDVEFRERIPPNRSKEYIIEYYTEPPQIMQESQDGKRMVTVYSDINYTDILTYTDIPETKSGITLYWYPDANDYQEYIGEGYQERVDITNNEQFEVTFIDTNNNDLIDRVEWITPHLSNQTFEISLNILNVQSYPTVGGKWRIDFQTQGTADLTITAVEGTVYGEDIEFDSLRCGDQVLDPAYDGSSVVYEDYSCESTGHHTVSVITGGKHAQKFQFGDLVAYARNLASNLPKTLNIQGKLTNGTGGLYNQSGDFSFKIYDQASGGSHLWEENKTLDVDDGIYDTVLGNQEAITLDFDKPYYLGIEVNDDGEMTPRINLTAHPYSFRAHVAEEAVNLTCTNCINETQIDTSGTFTIQGNLQVEGDSIKLNTEDVCLENGTNCPSGALSTSPWTNNTNEIYPAAGYPNNMNATNIEADSIYNSGSPRIEMTDEEVVINLQ